MSKTSRPVRQLQAATLAASVPVPGTEGEGTARTCLPLRGHQFQVASLVSPSEPGARLPRAAHAAAQRREGGRTRGHPA
jgi:hypothetical protein